ncbi:MAG: hypothetical protein AB1374_04575 [Bacillota bacterium]
MNTPDKYKQLDAIEIQLGQGAQGASPQRIQARFSGDEIQSWTGKTCAVSTRGWPAHWTLLTQERDRTSIILIIDT